MHLNHHRGGVGPPLVLIHGLGLRWELWKPILDRLQTEREVVAFDLPGFGGSPPPPSGTPPGAASLSRLVAEFLDELGLERPHVVGNSLGGWVALELAKLGRASSTTVISPAGFHNRGEALFQRASLLTSFRMARLVSRRAGTLARSSLARRLLLGQYFAKPLRIPAVDAAAMVRGAAGATWFTPTLMAITSTTFERGASIQVPVTIAWGEKDRLLLPRQAARAARAIPGARVLTLRGCGHVPMYDDPDQVAAAVLEGSRPGADSPVAIYNTPPPIRRGCVY